MLLRFWYMAPVFISPQPLFSSFWLLLWSQLSFKFMTSPSIIISAYIHIHIDILGQCWWLEESSSCHNRIYHPESPAFCFCCCFWDGLTMQTHIPRTGLKFPILLSPPVGEPRWGGLHHHSRLLVGKTVYTHLEQNRSILQHSGASRDAPRQLFSPGRWPGWLYNGSLLPTSFLSFHHPVCLNPLLKTILRCYNTPHAIWAKPDHAVDLGPPGLLE